VPSRAAPSAAGNPLVASPMKKSVSKASNADAASTATNDNGTPGPNQTKDA